MKWVGTSAPSLQIFGQKNEFPLSSNIMKHVAYCVWMTCVFGSYVWFIGLLIAALHIAHCSVCAAVCQMPTHSNTLSIDVVDMAFGAVCVAALSLLVADVPRSLNVYAYKSHKLRFEEDLAIKSQSQTHRHTKWLSFIFIIVDWCVVGRPSASVSACVCLCMCIRSSICVIVVENVVVLKRIPPTWLAFIRWHSGLLTTHTRLVCYTQCRSAFGIVRQFLAPSFIHVTGHTCANMGNGYWMRNMKFNIAFFIVASWAVYAALGYFRLLFSGIKFSFVSGFHCASLCIS